MRSLLLTACVGTLVAASCTAADGVDVDEAVSIDVYADVEAPPSTDGVGEPGGETTNAGPLDWGPCSSPNPVVDTECATLLVPLDHDDPDGRQLEIAVARADTANEADRIGSLVFNPGGPGGSGVDFLVQVAAITPPQVAERFDLVGFDPRGVGASTAVACDVEIDDGIVLVEEGDDRAYADLVARTAGELETCTDDTIDIAPFLGTNNAARDLDFLRAALGDDALTYVGYSYGTRLGSTYAHLFPDRVRALVLDAAVKPTTDAVELDLGQADGFDLALSNFAAACDADSDCPLTDVGPALDVLEGLRLTLDEVGSLPTDDPERILTRGELDLGVIAALYSKDSWPFLAEGLFLAETEGDGTLLQVLADGLSGRQPDGSYDNSNAANLFINCADEADRPPLETVRDDAERVADRSEYFDDALRASTGCLFVVPSADPLEIGPAPDAPPILVLGNTGDPATPFEWSVELAEFLESAVLVSVDAEGHTAYGTIECVTEVVNAYLIDLVVPEEGTGCSDEAGDDVFVPIEDTAAGLLVELFGCLGENGVDVPDVSVADVLADPAGEVLGEFLDPTDPAFAAATFACSDIVLELQGEL